MPPPETPLAEESPPGASSVPPSSYPSAGPAGGVPTPSSPGGAPHGGPATPHGGPATPPGRPLLPPEPALQHRSTAALLVALLSLAGFLGFNFDLQRGILIVLYALLAGVVAFWLALTAIRRARRSRMARPRGAVTAIVIAGAGIALSVSMLLAFALFSKQLTSYGRCLSGAGTVQTQQSCYSQLTHGLNRQLSLLGSSSHR